MKEAIGIIGFGRFGRLVAGYLKDSFDLMVYDIVNCRKEAALMGVETGSLENVANRSIVILCVPISEVQSALEEITPHLARNALVIDTCSVKEYPVSLMKAILPNHTNILGTHPLFGPDSAAQGLQGKKIVLCPVRIGNLKRIVLFLRYLKLDVTVCSPEAHDRRMASTQAIVQFLGRAFLNMGLTYEETATPGYERLIRILEVVQNDTWQLFCDLQNFNRFARGTRQKLIESLRLIDRKLEGMSTPSLEQEPEEKTYESRISRRTRRI